MLCSGTAVMLLGRAEIETEYDWKAIVPPYRPMNYKWVTFASELESGCW